MIQYLIRHTTSVFVTIGVLFILGLLSYGYIPTSLLPEISIPRINVHVASPHHSAEHIESKMVAPLRVQLQQANHLKKIHSITENNHGTIELTFNYGTDMGLAFIAVNEIIDEFMSGQSKEMQRPIVTKENVSDIPVCRLMVVPIAKNNSEALPYEITDLSENCQSVIQPRLEQLTEISSAKITGTVDHKIIVTFHDEAVKNMGIQFPAIKNILNDYQIDAGQVKLKEGTAEYYVSLSSGLKTIEDIKKVNFLWGNRILQLEDISQIEEVVESEGCEVYYNGHRAISFELIKAPDVRMADFNKSLQDIKNELEKIYPQYEFHVLNDQSKLLESTINSLFTDLMTAMVVVLLVASFFFGSFRLSCIVSLCMMISLSISLGILFLLGFSLNMFSLVGLILATGLMIDNALIVTDNITQFRWNHFSLESSCIKGTQEVMGPMLSSSLTTIVVFCPLLFLGEIAGELFYEQSISVAICIVVSYIVAIAVLPAIYRVIMNSCTPSQKNKHAFLYHFYDAGVHFVFKYSKLMIRVSLLTIPLCYWLFYHIEKESIPTGDSSDIKMHIVWNEPLAHQEAQKRISNLLDTVDEYVNQYATYMGGQRNSRQPIHEQKANHVELYINLHQAKDMKEVITKCCRYLEEVHPMATYSILPPESIIESLFPSGSADMLVKLYPYNDVNTYSEKYLSKLSQELSKSTGCHVEMNPFTECIDLQMDHKKMAFNGVKTEDVFNYLRMAFNPINFEIDDNDKGEFYRPQSENLLDSILKTRITDFQNPLYGLAISQFVKLDTFSNLQQIEADTKGRFIPLRIKRPQNTEQIEKATQEFMKDKTDFDFRLEGSIYEHELYTKNIAYILFISVILMYLIMVAQFESFVQPLLILVEIPINTAITLILLPIFGETLNIMSAVGLVVSCGIVINDSILKIDVINDLRKKGLPLKEAIHQAGKKRLRSIIMTALTSVLALLPILLSKDVGAEIQKPFAVTMFITLLTGTFVSLFIIPVFYWFIYKKNDKKNHL